MAELYKLKPGFSLMAGFMENAIFKFHGETFKTLEGLNHIKYTCILVFPCTLKYFWSMLHVQLNTFGVFSVYV
jgi:hypothetical protein